MRRLLRLVPLLLPFAAAIQHPLAGQNRSQSGLWEAVPRLEVDASGARAFRASSARLDRLDRLTLAQVLQNAPVDTAGDAEAGAVEIELPVPSRLLPLEYMRFRVVESPLAPPELEPHLGGVKTYSGRGVDDPTLTTRFSVSGAGLRGIVIGPKGIWVIEPVADEDSALPGEVAAGALHVSVFKDELRDRSPRIRFEPLRPGPRERAFPRPSLPALDTRPGPLAPERRTLRLAIAATKEFTDLQRRRARVPISDEAARDSALVAIVETLNLVQALYERELNVRFRLVPREREVIFTSEPDGYPGPPVGFAMLQANQSILDARIGRGNYDIGHVFTTGESGLARLASACDDTIKAEGGTGLDPSTIEKVFAIDYVAHEMGHQLNGRHTFNATRAGGCSAETRDAEYAFEPGSGSTVMGYAGICGDSSDVEKTSGEYFHVSSLQSIQQYLHYATCGLRQPISNRPPVVTAPPAWTIPGGTPFLLSASASDPDNDPLTYTWEEYYPGRGWSPEPSPPNEADEGVLRPSFRSYPPTSDPTRSFPALRGILLRNGSAFEQLPEFNRAQGGDGPLNFRVTARDGRGAFATADVAVEVVASVAGEPVGPFRVLRPIFGARVQRGSVVEIRWDVANTDQPPIGCANVRITLASEPHLAFIETLLASTPNDGSERVQVPPGPGSPKAWVMVNCIGNVFFNVSPQFRLLPAP